MKTAKDLIWAYLDGQCSTDESRAVEQAISQDPEFRQLFLISRRLHEHLQAMEADAPSMRFTQNVLDKLPAPKYGKALLPPRWLGWYALSFLLFSLALLWWLPDSPTDIAGSYTPSTEQISTLLAGLPYSMFLLLAAVTLAIMFIVLLDRWLKQRFVTTASV